MLSNTNRIGMLKWNTFSPDDEGMGYLSAMDTVENDFYLQHRPLNNLLNSKITHIDGTT